MTQGLLEPCPISCTGSKRCQIYASHQKKTLMLIVTGNALRFFTGFGNVILFSDDLCDFCRSFWVKNNTTAQIFLGHDDLLINEVRNVFERYSFFEISATF